MLKKKLERYLILFSILILCSCQQDDFVNNEVNSTNVHNHLNRKAITFNEINNESLFNKLETLTNKNFKDSLQRRTMNVEEFSIITEEVIYLEKDDTHSYTFFINNTRNNLIYNLVLSSTKNNNYTATLLSYNLTESEKKILRNDDYSVLNGKTNIYRISENANLNQILSNGILIGSDGCSTLEFEYEKCCSNTHTYKEKNICKCPNKPAENISNIIINTTRCENNPGGGNTNPGNTNPGNDNPTYGGGSNNNTPIITIPYENTKFIKQNHFINNTLTEEQRDFIMAIENSTTRNQILDFLNNSETNTNINFTAGYNNQEALEFAKQACNAFMIGGVVDFNLKVIIDPSFSNNTTLMNVFNKFGGLPTFGNYLKQFQKDFSVAHLMLTASSSLPNIVNAQVHKPENYIIKITFNTNNLNRPDLSIARTMMHEMIHAEIYRKMLSCAMLPHVNYLNYTSEQWINYTTNLRNNFPGIYDYYIRWAVENKNPDIQQHEMMAQHYRNIIVQSLIEFDNSYSNNLYQALSWVGLKNTTAWNNLSQDQIDNINLTIYNFEN